MIRYLRRGALLAAAALALRHQLDPGLTIVAGAMAYGRRPRRAL